MNCTTLSRANASHLRRSGVTSMFPFNLEGATANLAVNF